MPNLSATAVKNARPRERRYKISDGENLFLVVDPSGGKWWRLRYRFAGSEKSISLGTYPEVSLLEAREKKDSTRKLLAEGKNPTLERRQQKIAMEAKTGTLKEIGDAWLSKQRWESNYTEKVSGRLNRHIYPLLGHRPVAEISPPELLQALRRIENAGTIETAKRCKQHLARIYKYAIAAGKALHNPANGLEEAMVAKPKPKHFAAITDPDELGAALRAMHGFGGTTPQVIGALKLLPILMLRPGELVSMEWREWKQDDLWEIPGEKMKMGHPHVVPLPTQAQAILKELRHWAGSSPYVFPNARSRSRHMTVEALTAAFRRMGYSGDTITSHGFRATARTLLDEVLRYRPDYIEHQLAHQVRDTNGRAYNRTSFIDERREMLQDWADYLDNLRATVNLLT